MQRLLYDEIKEVERIVRNSDWEIDRKEVACTGSVYFELKRQNREWVVIRVATHRQYYQKFLTTYSVDPTSSGINLDELEVLLDRPFGDVGDVLL